jgi:uncharacterized protein
MTTLVIGASTNPDRYSNKAIVSLLNHGYAVLAIGNKEGEVNGVSIQTNTEIDKPIDTVTIYINPKLQEAYKAFLLQLNPRRVIFNPGTENSLLQDELEAAGIQCKEACTLVMLSIGTF